MSTAPTNAPPDPDVGVDPDIDYDALVTEDHKPVDRIFIEKLYRLLTRALYASWPGPGEGRPFLALVNVGWFYQRTTPAVVPDCLLSLDVACPDNLQVKQGHSYYQWDVGKPPDVVIEFVSDRTGGEESHKKALYAGLGVAYYAVYDPKHLLSADTLRVYELVGRGYRLTDAGPWPKVGLGLRLWEGSFEGHEDVWLRWCDAGGEIVPTGEERAARAEERIRALEAEVQRLKGQAPPETP
ncbi:MAG: Uma2 family endonuclease [Gemmataceae bacterium]|nr:Uma2 family endonuclease [Gemmataceae bacterium]